MPPFTASLAVVMITVGAPTAQPTAGQLRQWGFETLGLIISELQGPYTTLYADEARLDGYRAGPAFCWGAGVLLPALNAATRLEPLAAARLEAYGTALDAYWNPDGPVPGYDVLPVPKPMDRYYDDNEWLVLAFCEAYELTDNPVWLERAQRTMRYVLSGWDETLGGGIYWRENPKDAKNTCSNAPAAVCCYRLYQLTGEAALKDRGDAILAWTLGKLRDPEDGLMWDGMNLDGNIGKAKWSYNSALTMRALADRSRDAASLEQALVMARAAVRHWRDEETGALRDDAAFAHLLTESLLYLDERTGTNEFRPIVLQALGYLHANGRDAHGHYPKRWEEKVDRPLGSWKLIEQASAVRAYLLAVKE